MARHRNIRNINYSDDYDYDDVYGHSVEEDSCLSPSDAAQFLYDRSTNQQAVAHFMDKHGDIAEEEEPEATPRRASLDLRSLRLSEDDEARLMSCLDELRNVLGDTHPDSVLAHIVLKHDYDYTLALDELLNSHKPITPDRKVALNTPLVVVDQVKTPVISTFDNVPKVISSKKEPKSDSVVKGFNLASGSNSNSCTHTPREQSPVTGRFSPRPESSDEKVVQKLKENKKDPLLQYSTERGSEKDRLYIIVIGHVDAGKSTLMGHLLCELGEVSQKTLHKYEQESKKMGKQSFMYAWVLDETGEERERGITMDVGQAQFETKTKTVVILDAPGHADFIPNMITGAGQADTALLVVDATRGEFESGFDLGGQTREHAILVRSLGVNQLAVAVNKLDTTNWSQERFNEITNKLKVFLKQAGFKDSDVTFVPCSGLTGENLVKPPKEPALLAWYAGPSLLDVVDGFTVPERPVAQPLRLTVNDVYKGAGAGLCVAGRVETGVLNKGDKVLVCPLKEAAEVRSVAVDGLARGAAFAGDRATVTLAGVDAARVAPGAVLSCPLRAVPVASRFEARIVVFNVRVPITRGFPVLLHLQALTEPAHVARLKALLNKSTGEVTARRPRCLGSQAAAVVELQTARPVCLERYRDCRALGRVLLRVAGVTVAAGLVTDVYV